MVDLSKLYHLPNTERSSVSESPIWDRKTQRLYWVDIVDRKIFRYDLKKSTLDMWETPSFPTAIALIENHEEAILACADGVFLFNFSSGQRRLLCRVDDLKGNRLNEGKCDPQGRFWVGSMQTNLNDDGSSREMTKNSGALFCINHKGGSTRHSEFEFGISNTMAWSPDQKKFYFGDSIQNVIFAFDYDKTTGQLSNRSVLLENYPKGVPDGSAIDTEGNLWNARFGGGCVIKISPSGEVLEEITLPVTNPTSCSFAGAENNLLIVTSASFTMSNEAIKSNPLEGCLIALPTDSVGQEDCRFIMENGNV